MNPIRPFLNHISQIYEFYLTDETSVIIGEILLAEDVSVWPYTVLYGSVDSINIGARNNIQGDGILHISHRNAEKFEGSPLIIDEDAAVGHEVTLHGCRIDDRVLIGMGAIILNGTVAENDVMIGAGSSVPPRKRLESGYLYVGSSAKQVRLLIGKEKEFSKYSSAHYVRLAWQHGQSEQFSDDLARLKHSIFPFTRI